jgi:hypothetical protein
MTRDAREIAREVVRAHVRKSYKDRMIPQDEELIDAIAAAIEQDRAETIERCATIADEREESWGAASIRHEAAAIAKAIRTLRAELTGERGG